MKCFREETHEQPTEDEEGEDLVSKAEAEFFKIIEAEKKALEEAENKRTAAFAEMKQAIAQEEVTHEDYKQDDEIKEKASDEVGSLFAFVISFLLFLSRQQDLRLIYFLFLSQKLFVCLFVLITFAETLFIIFFEK